MLILTGYMVALAFKFMGWLADMLLRLLLLPLEVALWAMHFLLRRR